MGDIINRIGLYDLFARGLTGMIVILAARFFGIIGHLGVPGDEAVVPVWMILTAGYFCGVILEEVSFILERAFHSRKRITRKVCARKEYAHLDYEACKSWLKADGQEAFLDEPLAHIIMSSSFRIAFFIFLFFEVANVICGGSLISGNSLHPFVNIAFLIMLFFLFSYRSRHYIERRVELVFESCTGRSNVDSNLSGGDSQNGKQKN